MTSSENSWKLDDNPTMNALMLCEFVDSGFSKYEFIISDLELDLKFRYGKGNAKNGYRAPYTLYGPSKVYYEMALKKTVFDSYMRGLFDKEDFLLMCGDAIQIMRKQNLGYFRKHKHRIQHLMFATIAQLTSNITLTQLEGVTKISKSVLLVEMTNDFHNVIFFVILTNRISERICTTLESS